MFTYEKLANGLPAMIPFADRPQSVAQAGFIFAILRLCFLTLYLTTLDIFPEKKQPKYLSVGQSVERTRNGTLFNANK